MAKKINKSSFTKRFAAYIIDLLVIYCIASLFSSPFLNQKVSDKLAKEMIEISDKYENGEITSNDYIISYSSISYKISRNTGIYSIITILFEIVYFVILQIRWDGQTLGKKLMKIKVVSDNGDLEVNQMIFRSFIANFILLNIISFVLMLFCTKSIYFYGIAIFEIIQYVICIISLFMVMYGKEGLSIHDKIAHTRVVSV